MAWGRGEKVNDVATFPIFEALVGGGRRRDVCRARDGLAYLWVALLGRSGRQLAQELGIRPESVYKGARRGQQAQTRWRHVVG